MIEVKLAAMSEHIRSRAEAYLRGENPPVQSGEVLGPPLERLVAEVVGNFDLVDKEQVKETVKVARNAVADQVERLKEMAKSKVTFGFDEQKAKEVTLKNLDDLAQGKSCPVVVPASPELEITRGVALLIGEGHSEDNVTFVTSLVKAGQGFKGDVSMKEKGGAVFAGELVFTFLDNKVETEAWVKSYISHYGSSITRKKLTYAND